jgi:hypothetical protein
MPFAGELSLSREGSPLRAQIDFTQTDLVVSTGVEQVGSWPLEKCRIDADQGRFLVSLDEELAWFMPDDAITFARRVLDQWGTAAPKSEVVAVPDATVSSSPEVDAEGPPEQATGIYSFADLARRLRRIRPFHWLGLGLILGLVLFAAALGAGDRSRASFVSLSPATTTTIFPVVFSSGLGEVTMLWNEAAEDLGVALFLSEVVRGARMEVHLPEDLILYGTEHPVSGRVRTLMISAGPGEGNNGEVVLAAWGTLIAVTNPELGPDERRALLERLGADVDRPLTLGLNTETVEGGARYWLRSGVLGGRVLLGVQPVTHPET